MVQKSHFLSTTMQALCYGSDVKALYPGARVTLLCTSKHIPRAMCCSVQTFMYDLVGAMTAVGIEVPQGDLPEIHYHDSRRSFPGETLKMAVDSAKAHFKEDPKIIFVLLPDTGRGFPQDHLSGPLASFSRIPLGRGDALSSSPVQALQRVCNSEYYFALIHPLSILQGSLQILLLLCCFHFSVRPALFFESMEASSAKTHPLSLKELVDRMAYLHLCIFCTRKQKKKQVKISCSLPNLPGRR